MRLFIAIDIPEKAKQELIRSSQDIKSNSIKARMATKVYHITLAFLGDIEKNKIGDIKDCIDQSFDKEVSFSINEYGFFKGNDGKIIVRKVLFEESFVNQVYNLRELLKNKSIQYDKKAFNPHITISRDTVLKDGIDLKSMLYRRVECKVSSVILYNSVNIDGRYEYKTISSKSLE